MARLRDIKFKSFTAQILSIRPSRVLIEWELEETTQNLNNLRFFIDRGESPEDLKPVSPPEGIPAKTLPQFVDHTANLIDLAKVLYYKVRAVEFTGQTPVQTFETEPFTWSGEPDLVALYIIEEHLFAHEFVYGVPVLIFKKRREGIKDVGPEGTWDPVLKRNISSVNARNFDTPYVDGYYPPVPHWMDFEPDPKVVQIPEWGERQIRQTDIQFTNFPLLSNGDVILEVKPHRFYRIENVRFTEKNRTVMLQVARLNEVNRTDIENSLNVPQDVVNDLLERLEKRKNTPEF